MKQLLIPHTRQELWFAVLCIILLIGLMITGCSTAPTAAPISTPVQPMKEPALTPTEKPAATSGDEIAVIVSGALFTLGDLQDMEQVTVEATQKDEKKEYTGVRIQDLMEAAGAQGDTITLIADGGNEAEISVDSLSDECLLSYRTKGGLRAVLPGLDSALWIKGVVEIEVSEVSASAGVEVTDALGRTVAFSELPHRIVVPGKGSWMVGHPLYLFPEASERVYAMEARRSSVSDFIAAIEPGFNDKPHLEADAGPEQIAPLKPDAIITKSYMKEKLGNALETLGFPVIYVGLETPEQFYADIATIGQLFGDEARAQEITAFYQAKVDRIQERVAKLDESAKPSVLVIQHTGKGEEIAFKVPPASWMQTIEMEKAGGLPVWTEAAGSGWEVVNFEQIAAWDPDKIFVIVFRSDSVPVMEKLNNDLKWQSLQAVQNGDLYAFPGDYYGWDVPDPRWILGMTWAATKIHPDIFTDVDIMQEVYDFYGQMYGMSRASVDEHIIPQLSGSIQ